MKIAAPPLTVTDWSQGCGGKIFEYLRRDAAGKRIRAACDQIASHFTRERSYF